MGNRSQPYTDSLYKELQDPKEAALYLNECLKDDDPGVFLVACRDVIEANGGMKWIAEEIERSRSSLYKSFSPSGNPGINTLVDAMYLMGLEFEVKPIRMTLRKDPHKKPKIPPKRRKKVAA